MARQELEADVSKKMFGRSLTGGGASMAQVGGIVAERNRVAEGVSELERRLAVHLFAYLPKWKSARS